MILLVSGLAQAQAPRGAAAPATPVGDAASIEEAPSGPEILWDLVILPPSVNEPLESLQPGLEQWMRLHARKAGLDLMPPGKYAEFMEARGADKGPPTHRDFAASRDQLQSTAVMVSYFKAERDEDLSIRILVYEIETGRIVSGSQASGKLTELSTLTGSSLGKALERSGLAVGATPEDAPALQEFSAISRSIRHLQGQQPIQAWRELDQYDSPLAKSMRARINKRVEKAPDDVKAHLYVARGQSGRAIRMIAGRRNMKESEASSRFFLLQGEAILGLEKTENLTKAIDFFQRALKADPESLPAQLGLARAYHKAGRVKEAERAYLMLVSMDPTRPEAYEGLSELKADEPDKRAKYLIQVARQSSKRFEIQKAQEDYAEAAVTSEQVAAVAYQETADLQEAAGEIEAATESYAIAIESGADTSQNWKGIARTQRRMGNVEDAEVAFVEAKKKDPEDIETARHLGEIYARTERAEQAIPLLKAAHEKAPKNEKLRGAFAFSLHVGGQSEQALELLSPPHDPFAATTGDLAQASEIYRDLGDLPAARAALQQAIDLDPERPELHQMLAVVYDEEGNTVAAAEAYALADIMGARDAEAEYLAARDQPDWVPSIFDAFVSTFQTRRPVIRVAYLGLVESDDTDSNITRWVLPVAPDGFAMDVELQRAFGGRYQLVGSVVPPYLDEDIGKFYGGAKESERILNVVEGLEADAIVFGTIHRPNIGQVELDVHMFAGKKLSDVERLGNESKMPVIDSPFLTVNVKATAVYLVIILLIAYKISQGKGTVIINLDWGTEAVGMFNVQLSKREVSVTQAASGPGAANAVSRFRHKSNLFKRFSCQMVDKETVFNKVPTGIYFAVIQGLLQDPTSNEVIGNFVEEKKIEVKRGETIKIRFNFKSEECPVSIRVTLQERLAKNAMLSIKGQLGTLRYLADGETMLYLSPGQYTISVGHQDRVVEMPLRISTPKPMNLAVEMSSDRGLVLVGCQEAVEPYLNGDFAQTASLLEQAGHSELARRIQAASPAPRAAPRPAPTPAAPTQVAPAQVVATPNPALSSEALELADSATISPPESAQVAQSQGDLESTAQAYEESYDYENALNCYQQLGDMDKVIELLERLGDFYEAGKVARENDQIDRAISNFQGIEARDELYPAACRHLADIFLQREEPEIAYQTLEGVVRILGEENLDIDTQDKLSLSLEALGRSEEALALCEIIQTKNYHHPGISTRIENLRKAVSSEETVIKEVPGVDSQAETVAGEPDESRYEVISELGRGGMGVVYKARDKRLGRTIALKRLPDNLRDHPKVIELFLREARSAAALNHPNVVTLFDAGEDAGQYFITMEMLQGMPLDDILRKKGKLSPKDVCRLGAQIATGLAYAHRNKIVHRDIKTANLFFTSDKVVKIMDFGLAKMMEEVRRAATVIGGTPYYMAPEQAVGDNVDYRADIYAFGVTLFEMAAGEVPFKEGDVTYHHRHTPAPDVRDREPSVPEPLAKLILQMMAKDREDRPQTGEEICDLLNQMMPEIS